MKRIEIGPNSETLPVFNTTISSDQQSHCLVLALWKPFQWPIRAKLRGSPYTQIKCICYISTDTNRCQ